MDEESGGRDVEDQSVADKSEAYNANDKLIDADMRGDEAHSPPTAGMDINLSQDPSFDSARTHDEQKRRPDINFLLKVF